MFMPSRGGIMLGWRGGDYVGVAGGGQHIEKSWCFLVYVSCKYTISSIN